MILSSCRNFNVLTLWKERQVSFSYDKLTDANIDMMTIISMRLRKAKISFDRLEVLNNAVYRRYDIKVLITSNNVDDVQLTYVFENIAAYVNMSYA